MASAKMAEFLFIFDAVIVAFLVAYGQSSPLLSQYIQGPLTTLTTPFQDFNSLLVSQGFTGFSGCGFTDVKCISQQANNGFIFAGTAIVWVGGTFFTILNKIGAGIFLIFGLTQFLANDFGVPFLSYIFTAYLIISILYGLSLIRGTSTGV